MASLVLMIGDAGSRSSRTSKRQVGKWPRLSWDGGGQEKGSGEGRKQSQLKEPRALSPPSLPPRSTRSHHTSLSPPVSRKPAERRAQTLPVGTTPPNAVRSTAGIGSKIKQFFRYTVLRQSRNARVTPLPKDDNSVTRTATISTSSSSPSSPELGCLPEPCTPMLSPLSGIISDISNISSTDSVGQTSSASSSLSSSTSQSLPPPNSSVTITAVVHTPPNNTENAQREVSARTKSLSPLRSRLPRLKSLSPLRSRLPRLKSLSPRRHTSSSERDRSVERPARASPTNVQGDPTTSKIPRRSFFRGRSPLFKKKDKVANCGPADYNYDETISTLRYANRAKNIKNRAKINEDPKDALLRQFQKEIEDLKKQLEDGGTLSGDEDSGEDEEDDGDEGGGGGSGKKGKKKKKGRGLSKEKMAAIQAQIEADRRQLEEKKDMAEEEKRKVEQDLLQKEGELGKAMEEQEQLANKLAAIEKKIIVGGENLLEKAEEQERMLQASAKELDERKAKEEELRRQLEEKEQVRLDIEEKYSNLQEEVAGKTKKLKKVWTMLMQAKSEIADLQQEHQREMEGLLENVRQLSRELHLQMLIIDNFIPPEFQEMIEQYVHWNEDIGEWQLKCVAYSGNNMRKQSPVPDKDKDLEPDLSHVYLAYTAEGAEMAMRPKTAKPKTGRPKTAASRPKSSKPKKRKDQDIDSLLQ